MKTEAEGLSREDKFDRALIAKNNELELLWARLQKAQDKLRELGVIWEEGKGYVYDGKS